MRILKPFLKVIGSYSLEEKVLSVVALLVFVFFMTKSIAVFVNPTSVFASQSVYTEAIINDKPTLINPLYVDFAQANRDISALVFSGLVKYNPDTARFINDLGELTISEDKKEYIFKIKDDVTWHDGEPFSVDDVMFTYNIVLSETFQNPVLKANFEGVKIEKIDDASMKFVLERPNSFFITNLNVGILPEHILQSSDIGKLPSNDFNLNPVGTGPYQVKSKLELLDDGRQKLALERYENYYGINPSIAEIRFNIYPDEVMLLDDIDSINIIAKVNKELSTILEGDRFDVLYYSLPQYVAVFFNTNDDLLSNQKMRLALTKSIDKAELLGNIENVVPVDTPLLQLSQDDWLFKPNIEEAQGALFDLGYKYQKNDEGEVIEGQNYRKNSDGDELSVTLTVRQLNEATEQFENQQETIDHLSQKWEQVGIKTNIEYLPDQEYFQRLSEKNYQMILAGQSMGYNLDIFPFWHSSQIDQGSALNLSRYSNFGADTQIEKIRESFDQEEQENRMETLAQIISDDVPALFLYRQNYILATDGKVKNVNFENLAYPSDRFSFIKDWEI
ncbi:hypothetical protein GF376_01570 [Candidatus Peregrinibacteria bacterium]|nr:hypothetical protein [Candidatus Peregrinibacteria bacterium]